MIANSMADVLSVVLKECPNGWIFVEAESKCKRPEETDCFGNICTISGDLYLV